MTEREQFDVALGVCIQQRNAAENQVIDLQVALAGERQKIKTLEARIAELEPKPALAVVVEQTA